MPFIVPYKSLNQQNFVGKIVCFVHKNIEILIVRRDDPSSVNRTRGIVPYRNTTKYRFSKVIEQVY